jgi:hypothetical protein
LRSQRKFSLALFYSDLAARVIAKNEPQRIRKIILIFFFSPQIFCKIEGRTVFQNKVKEITQYFYLSLMVSFLFISLCSVHALFREKVVLGLSTLTDKSKDTKI